MFFFLRRKVTYSKLLAVNVTHASYKHSNQTPASCYHYAGISLRITCPLFLDGHHFLKFLAPVSIFGTSLFFADLVTFRKGVVNTSSSLFPPLFSPPPPVTLPCRLLSCDLTHFQESPVCYGSTSVRSYMSKGCGCITWRRSIRFDAKAVCKAAVSQSSTGAQTTRSPCRGDMIRVFGSRGRRC